MITRGNVGNIFINDDLIARLYGYIHFAGYIFLLFNSFSISVDFLTVDKDIKSHSRGYMEIELFSLKGEVSTFSACLLLNFIPEFLVVVGILVLHVTVEIRSDRNLA
ncbi:hypothetical protein D3C78_1427520 [compost metagenome]